MKNLRDLHVQGKRVLVRVDFNVPMNDKGEVSDDLRIRMVLPTLEYLIEQGAKIILCTHMGRPKGQRVEKYSLAPVAAYLAKLLNKPVPLAPDCTGPEVEKVAKAVQNGELLMLENLRFHPEEEKNDPIFSQQLAALAEVYVNDAFAVSHRAHASVVGVAAYVADKAPGFLLQKEIDYFHRAFDEPQRPLIWRRRPMGRAVSSQSLTWHSTTTLSSLSTQARNWKACSTCSNMMRPTSRRWFRTCCPS